MRDDKRDHFVDELLEAALKQCRGEEPRAGLEMRILAGIRSRERAARRRWLVWAVAFGAGMLAAIVLVLHSTRTPIRHPIPSVPSALRAPLQAANPQARSGSADSRLWSPRLVPGPKEKPRTPKRGVRATESARPEQFPTPLPLTEQEKLLLAYLGKTPKPDLVAGPNKTDEARVNELAIPEIRIADLEIKPLDDSQPQGK